MVFMNVAELMKKALRYYMDACDDVYMLALIDADVPVS